MRTLLLAVLAALPASAAEQTFGKPPTLVEAVPLASAAADPAAYGDREILLEGRVLKVCQKKGCWMILKDGDKDVRITFKDYAFFVPKDSAKRLVRAQGVLKRETLSVKAARHFLKDEGAGKAEIAKVKEPVETLSFIASGVTLLD